MLHLCYRSRINLTGRLIKLYINTETAWYNDGGPRLFKVVADTADYKVTPALKSCHSEFYAYHLIRLLPVLLFFLNQRFSIKYYE